MDLHASAAVVLSAAGQTGHHGLVERACGIVGADMVAAAAEAVARPWLADGGDLITPGTPAWPTGLASLGEAAPCALWTWGSVPVDPSLMVAIVGSRRSTQYGRDCARVLARAVVASGRAVVSGGASGIDAAAHGGALDVSGCTVLFAAGGAGTVYPENHQGLYERVRARGAVVWEFPAGTRLARRSFLHRNRLIASAAGATVVVEAALRSGALNTGRTAADLGRLVLGVPGRIDSPASTGVLRAVADGWAVLLLGDADLTELLDGAAG
jgi:DNA processing protein